MNEEKFDALVVIEKLQKLAWPALEGLVGDRQEAAIRFLADNVSVLVERVGRLEDNRAALMKRLVRLEEESHKHKIYKA